MSRLIAQTLALTLSIAAATPAAAQVPAVEALVPEIVSSATAERSAPADLAVVTLRFSRTGATPAAAGRSLAQTAAPGGTVVVAPVIRVTATVHGRWELVEDR